MGVVHGLGWSKLLTPCASPSVSANATAYTTTAYTTTASSNQHRRTTATGLAVTAPASARASPVHTDTQR
jgi:hypothetical protein